MGRRRTAHGHAWGASAVPHLTSACVRPPRLPQEQKWGFAASAEGAWVELRFSSVAAGAQGNVQVLLSYLRRCAGVGRGLLLVALCC